MDDGIFAIKNLGLVDLHIHAGATVPAFELWNIAHEQGLKLPFKDFWKFKKFLENNNKEKDYEKYLRKFELTEHIQSSPLAISKTVETAISLSYIQSNVTTIELRFNPLFRNKKGVIDLDYIILYALHAADIMQLKFPVKAGIILCMDRRLSVEENAIIVEKAIKYKDRGVIGIDLAGSVSSNENSKKFKPTMLKDIVKKAKEAGLGVTIHTGEVTGPDEMWEVIETLKPNRIGHGIAAVKDKKLLETLYKENIVLETCPSSNLQTGVIKDFEHMRQIYKTFKDFNVPFTINTDGPIFLKTTLFDEINMLLSKNILSIEDIKQSIKIAKGASFI